MSDQPQPITVTVAPSGKYPRELSHGEMTSLEKVALLRGKCGRYRAAMRDAMDQLRPDEPAYKRLALALEDQP